MARIRHIQGNFIRMMIPLGLETLTTIDGVSAKTVADFVPNQAYPVQVVLRCGVTNRKLTPTSIDGNMITVEDNGVLPVGAYHIEILCRDDDGKPMRFRKNTVIEIVNETERGDSFDTDEFDVVAYYPVLKGRECAVVIGDDSVTILEGLPLGGDPDYTDNYAEISARQGSGSMQVTKDEVILTI